MPEFAKKRTFECPNEPLIFISIYANCGIIQILQMFLTHTENLALRKPTNQHTAIMKLKQTPDLKNQ